MNTNRLLVSLILSCMFTVLQCQESRKYDFSPLDQLIGSWIQKSYYPGASIIIAKNDSVVFENATEVILKRPRFTLHLQGND